MWVEARPNEMTSLDSERLQVIYARYTTRQREAEAARLAWVEALREAAVVYSYREIAASLGISPQRVHQLVGGSSDARI